MWTRACLVVALAACAAAITKDQLYAYGPHLDVQLPKGSQVSSPEIPLRVPVHFFGEFYNTLFVNNFGVISFRTDIPTFQNSEFPLAWPAIAAFYTNVDTTASGTVYYRETNETFAIIKARETVNNNFPKYYDWKPKSIFIATWSEVGYNSEGYDRVNTFQIAIISGDNESFVEFLYPNDGIQWIQGSPNPSGMPDARAQAGFVAEDGRFYTLRGSGSHQIRNIVLWSNTQEPGRYIYRVGDLPPDGTVDVPDHELRDFDEDEEFTTCASNGASACHIQARCVDYQTGICCQCNEGFYGNGKTCIKIDVPLRVNGKLNGEVNGVSFNLIDVQSYVLVLEGKTYTALSRLSERIGDSFQLLNVLGGVIGWLFSKPLGSAKNGYQLTGAVFNHTADVYFPQTRDRITIRQSFYGHDVFDQINMEADVRGSLPYVSSGARIEVAEYEEQYTQTDIGTVRSNSKRIFKIRDIGNVIEATITQTFTFNPCRHAPVTEEDQTPYTLKVDKNYLNFDRKEGIVRYSMGNKVVPLGQEDPCLKGRATCGENSACVVDGDGYKCVCNLGYQISYTNYADQTSKCVDFDECESGTHNCDENAICHNDEGSFRCQCKGGYDGDGVSCTRITGCRSKICDHNAQCIVKGADSECVCNEGYTGNGERCEQIAVQAGCDVLHDCSTYATCEYSTYIQSYECRCKPGYSGNGYSCYPERLISTTPTPDFGERTEYPSYSTYTATPTDSTSYIAPTCTGEVCSCPRHFVRETQDDGTIMCVRIPQNYEPENSSRDSENALRCTNHNDCPPKAVCAYSKIIDGYECQCPEGYEGDGYECVERDACYPTCGPHASCEETRGGTRDCVCEYGYHGDGHTCLPDSASCTDDSQCEYNAVCRLDSYTNRQECQCVEGYVKDQNDACIPDGGLCNGAKCAEHASCLWDDKYEVHYCQCDQGYEGTALEQCYVKRDTCEVAHDCDSHAVCKFDQETYIYKCECVDGYAGDGYSCTLIPNCKNNPYLCDSQASCVRKSDGYSCECNSGFRGNGSYCDPMPKQPGNFLLVSGGMFIFHVPFVVTPRDFPMPIQNGPYQTAVGLDVDCQTGRVYWGDITGRIIKSTHFDGSDNQNFLSNNVQSPEGLSVDWVSRNLYWTDSFKRTIEVANLDTKLRKVLFDTNLNNPRGIAVHPQRGKVFWSDWNRDRPKIEWANLDGSERSVFLESPDVKLPNSLAIDWFTDSLCFTDAGHKKVECVQLDSHTRNLIASNCTYPFGLAITEDHFYWSDWKSEKIELVNRRSLARSRIPVNAAKRMYGMAVAPDQCIGLSNTCMYQNGRCPIGHLCLPNGTGGRSCVCGSSDDLPSLC